MLILALDTASHLCAAALYDSAADRIAGKAVEDIGRGHAERLMAVIADALREADADYGAIARIAVTVGPAPQTASTACTSGMKWRSRFWMPCFSVAVEDGQPAHAPFMCRNTVPSR
jgi:hypothetical protein